MNFPEVSIITVSYNSISTISDTINSVLDQSYKEIDYIIVDGSSTDGTINVIKSYGDRILKLICEPDSGMYDAINKGIKLASGNIIGILNSDDVFNDNSIVEQVANIFNNEDIEALFGDVVFVKPDNLKKVVRYYSSKQFHPGKFRYGYMPAHTSFFAKKELFERYGNYKTDYKIAADFELLVRFLYVHKIKYKYVEKPFIIMRTGGISNRNIRSRFILNKEIVRACRENLIETNYFLIYLKYFKKIFEFLGNKKYPGTE
jgi:glycosyltransferase involved in cell wall biosynthesis